MSSELFAGYIPVLHQGYIEAIERHPDATIGVFDDSVLSAVPYLKKDIRRLEPRYATAALRGLGRNAFVLDYFMLEEALARPIIMPGDDVTKSIANTHPDADITVEPVFLRWDRDSSGETTALTPDRHITLNHPNEIISALNHEAQQSSNWWRHIGAAVVEEGKVVRSAHNSSLPTEHTSWIEGDPRITARKGEAIERTVDIHAEARLIAEASRDGLSLAGGDLYTSTFPCPNCAKLIALSGVKSCYYIEGYAMLDGATILQQAHVEIVKIETDDFRADRPGALKPYPGTNQS